MRFQCKSCETLKAVKSYMTTDYIVKGYVLLPCLTCLNIQEHIKVKRKRNNLTK